MDIGGRKDRSQRTRWMPADAPEDPDQTTDLKVPHERSGQADSGCTAIRTAKPADGRGRRWTSVDPSGPMTRTSGRRWTSMDTPGRSCNRAVEDPARCSYRCSNNRGCRRTWADVGGLREQIQALGHLVLSVPSKRTVAEKRPRAAHRGRRWLRSPLRQPSWSWRHRTQLEQDPPTGLPGGQEAGGHLLYQRGWNVHQ